MPLRPVLGAEGAGVSKERPILFNGDMVKAILAGKKTQTQRPVTAPHGQDADAWAWSEQHREWEMGIAADFGRYGSGGFVACPFGVVGDRLWVRETWAHDGPSLEAARSSNEDAMGDGSFGPYYRADRVHEDTGLTWRPSIHMPRWASRITLEVTDVRVERLQDISEADAKLEGCKPRTAGNGEHGPINTYRTGYVHLWNEINGPGSWLDNPWVWVVCFRRIP